MSNIHFISLAGLPLDQVHSTLKKAVGSAIAAMDDNQVKKMMTSPIAELAEEAYPMAIAA